MNALLLFLRKTLIVGLVGVFVSVNTFTGEAFAQGAIPTFVNSCTLQRTDQTNQPDFQNPPFAYADKKFKTNIAIPEKIAEYRRVVDPRTITFDAVEDNFYLEGDESGTAYNGYLYKTIFPGKNGVKKTIVQDDDTNDDNSLPGKLKIVNYAGNKDNMVGTFTPPTIVVSLSREDDITTDDRDESRPNSISLNLINDLPVNVQLAGSLPQTKENLENQSQYTNIHYHGFNVSPLLGADDVLVDVPSNVTPKPIKIPKDSTKGQAVYNGSDIEIPIQGDAGSDKVSYSYENVNFAAENDGDAKYNLIPASPLGETTPDSSTGSETDLPGGYYPGDNPSDPKYGGPISEYNMDVNIPEVHQSGVFWYHSHAHSLSDNQVRGGLSGGIIITGSDGYYKILSKKNGIQLTSDTQGNLTIGEEPEEFSVNQKIMMFKDFNNVLDGGGPTLCFTVNGQVNPKITIQPGEVQLWRMANIGADTYMNIALEKLNPNGTPGSYTAALANPNGEQNFYILSRDGDFVEQVVPTDSVLMPPASRVDVLVVGGNTTAADTDDQSTYSLVSDFSTDLTKGPRWMTKDKEKPYTGSSYVLATVEVGEDSNKVCYEYKKFIFPPLEGRLFETVTLTLPGICEPSGDTEGLYEYIKKQKATSQTRRPQQTARFGSDFGVGDLPFAVDKILPNPELLFADLEECQGNENFVDNFCLTPSDLYSDPLTQKRYFYFSQGDGKFFLQGFDEQNKLDDWQKNDPNVTELYDGIRIDKVSQVGDLEEWHLINTTGSPHVFHIHQLDFVVTEVDFLGNPSNPNPPNPCKKADGSDLDNGEFCTYNNYTVSDTQHKNAATECQSVDGDENKYKCPLLPQGYRDVIQLPPFSETVVRIPFVNPFITGPFVYHCHILFHEDSGMMNNLKVVNPKGYGKKDIRRQIKRLLRLRQLQGGPGIILPTSQE